MAPAFGFKTTNVTPCLRHRINQSWKGKTIMEKMKIDALMTSYKKSIKQLKDINEFLETKKAISESVWPEQANALKSAFEAYDAKDWGRCRHALEIFFEYESAGSAWLLADLAPSRWSYRHLMRWLTMLYATGLSVDSEDSPARVFYIRLVEHIEDRAAPQQKLVA
jgi:hypothetical protein